jgi:hypothetical protein
LTVTVCPAAVTVPVLGEPDAFCSTASVTVPFPLPELPLVMEIHGTLLDAVQLQPVGAVTVTA